MVSPVIVVLLVAGTGLLVLGALALFRIQGSGSHTLKVAGVEISSTSNALFILALGGALLALAAVRGTAGSTSESQTTTTMTTAGKLEVEAPVDVALSGHIWASANLGSPDVLDGLRYEYRAGVSHVEDLPPAGVSTTALTFDVSGLVASDVVEAQLDLRPTRVEGDPFSAYGDLLVERVEFASVIDARQATGPLLLRAAEPPGVLGVTDALKQALGLGRQRFQVRLRFTVSLPRNEELTARDRFVEWDYPDGPTLLVLTQP